MEQTIVGVADCRIAVARGEVLTTYALGSCIGLAAHDPESGAAGLLHFMLPDSSLDPSRGEENPYMFGDTGIRALLSGLQRRGARLRRLVLHAIGGAQMISGENVLDIGKRNYLATRKILWREGLMLSGAEVGGAQSRTVRIEAGSGRLWIHEGGIQRELSPGRMALGGTRCRTEC